MNGSVRKKNWLCGKVTCFSATDNGVSTELKTVRFNLEPKRCKSVSLSAKRSVSTLVGLAFTTTRGNMERFCGKQLLVWKFELDAVGFFKTKFTGE